MKILQITNDNVTIHIQGHVVYKDDLLTQVEVSYQEATIVEEAMLKHWAQMDAKVTITEIETYAFADKEITKLVNNVDEDSPVDYVGALDFES